MNKIKLPVVVFGGDGGTQVVDMHLDVENVAKKSIRPYTPGARERPQEAANRCVLFDKIKGKEDSDAIVVGMAEKDLIKKLTELQIIKIVS